MPLEKIGILGLNRTGGSLALRLRERTLAREVAAWDPDPATAEQAQRARVASRLAREPFSVVRGAQVVVAALSPLLMRDELQALAGELTPGAIVTSTSAVAPDLVPTLEALLPPGVAYVGGRPLFRGRSSPEGYDATLFDDCVYCLFPSPGTRPDAIEFMSSFVTALGAQPFFPDVAELAGWSAAVEALPQVLGLALHHVVLRALSEREVERVAGAAFYAAGDAIASDGEAADAWLAGRESLVPVLDSCIAELQRLRAAIAAGETTLQAETAALREGRQRLLARAAERAEQAELAPAAHARAASVFGNLFSIPRPGRQPAKEKKED